MPWPLKMSWILPTPNTGRPARVIASSTVGPGGGTARSRRSGLRTNAPSGPSNGRAITRPTRCGPVSNDRAIAHHSYSCSKGTTSLWHAIWNTESPLV